MSVNTMSQASPEVRKFKTERRESYLRRKDYNPQEPGGLVLYQMMDQQSEGG